MSIAIILAAMLIATYALRFVGCPDAVFDAVVALVLILMILGLLP